LAVAWTFVAEPPAGLPIVETPFER
jgi:hypothetical protein